MGPQFAAPGEVDVGERIGILGGTFDPIHNAHLEMGRAAAITCALSRVYLVPAAHPPHRPHGPSASYEDRYRMVEIACAGDPFFLPSRLEAGSGKSYTIHTVERLRSSLNAEDSIYFIIGADAFAEIQSWFRWRELARLVTFAVVARPGATYDVPDNLCVKRIQGVSLPISSSEIRSRLVSGNLPADLPQGVLAYIHEHNLYT